MSDPIKNVVLVHGGFVDGSGWQGVYAALRADGYDVGVVQNPTLTLQQDAAFTRQILDGLGGPAVLVGHSYGGAVITEAGTHPNVAALVYVAAFAPDTGESVGSLIAGFPADGPQPADPAAQGRILLLDRAKFHASFAADLLPTWPRSWLTRRSRGRRRPCRAGHRPRLADQAAGTGHDRGPDRPRRPSAPCPSGLGRPLSRWRRVTPFTSRSHAPPPTSSSRPHKGRPRTNPAERGQPPPTTRASAGGLVALA